MEILRIKIGTHSLRGIEVKDGTLPCKAGDIVSVPADNGYNRVKVTEVVRDGEFYFGEWI